jgi:hypothetical protein
MVWGVIHRTIQLIIFVIVFVCAKISQQQLYVQAHVYILNIEQLAITVGLLKERYNTHVLR